MATFRSCGRRKVPSSRSSSLATKAPQRRRKGGVLGLFFLCWRGADLFQRSDHGSDHDGADSERSTSLSIAGENSPSRSRSLFVYARGSASSPAPITQETPISDLGDTGEVFIEDGIDKSPVRGGETQGLGDDQSFELPKFADAFYRDPECDHAGPHWVEFRKIMNMRFENTEEDEDHKAASSMEFLQSTGSDRDSQLIP